MRIIWISLALCLCASCIAPYKGHEYKEQPLIFPEPAVMSSGFATIEEDGRTVTLNAELGTPQAGVPMGTLQIQRLSSVCVVTEGRQDMRIGPLQITRPGTQLYTAFSARAEKPGRISLGVYQHGRLTEGLLKVLEPDKDWKRYRFVLRVLEPVDGLTLRIQTDAAVEIEEFGALCKTPADKNTQPTLKENDGPAANDI